MNQVILVAHGRLAIEMKNSAEMIFGELPNFHAIEFLTSDGLDSISEKISKTMEALNQPTLILADLFCGTPYNASCSVVLKNPQYEATIVAGMSLPLVLEVASAVGSQSVVDLAKQLPALSSSMVKMFEIPQDDEEDL